MFSEEKLSQVDQKRKEQQSIVIKCLCSNTLYIFEYGKNTSVKYLLKCS